MDGQNQPHIWIYDCGCVASRPKEQSCKSFGTRWRVYLTPKSLRLKCRDCGRMHFFELAKAGVQITRFEGKEEMDKNE